MYNPLKGSYYLLQGAKIISKPGIRGVVMIPLSINIILFGLLIWYGAGQFSDFVEWLLPDKAEWFRRFLWPIFALISLIIVFFAFTLVANIVGAPFNGLLSERVEEHLTGIKPDQFGGWRKMINNFIPSLIAELKKLLYIMLLTSLYLLIFIIPVINVIAPILWLVFSAWVLALEYVEYPMSAHNISFKELRKRLKERMLLTFGFGFSTLVITTIPLINFLAMPTAVAGATVMWVEEWSEKKKIAQSTDC
jgi:CysZ protein|tara:strand:+ start:2677 stop:3426 length:750 start_codon:yes stop_codon:yes gene_type:complete